MIDSSNKKSTTHSSSGGQYIDFIPRQRPQQNPTPSVRPKILTRQTPHLKPTSLNTPRATIPKLKSKAPISTNLPPLKTAADRKICFSLGGFNPAPRPTSTRLSPASQPKSPVSVASPKLTPKTPSLNSQSQATITVPTATPSPSPRSPRYRPPVLSLPKDIPSSEPKPSASMTSSIKSLTPKDSPFLLNTNLDKRPLSHSTRLDRRPSFSSKNIYTKAEHSDKNALSPTIIIKKSNLGVNLALIFALLLITALGIAFGAITYFAFFQ